MSIIAWYVKGYGVNFILLFSSKIQNLDVPTSALVLRSVLPETLAK
jgi:hypothetical protein